MPYHHIMFILVKYLLDHIPLLPDFVPPVSPSESGSSISAGAVVGIVIAGLLVILLVVGIVWWKCFLRRKTTLEQGNLQGTYVAILVISDSSC